MLPQTAARGALAEVRAILFDLDNTLVDRDAAVRTWLRRVLGDAGAVEEALARDDGGRADRGAFCAWLAARCPRLFEDAQAAWERFSTDVPALVKPRRDVVRTLERLSSRYRLALVTNGGARTQRAKLARAGLDRFFHPSRVLVSEEQRCAKPERAIYERALASLGVGAGEALFVGDHPLHDVAAPASLGMYTCWVAPPDRTGAAATLRVAHVRELPIHLASERP